MEYYLRVKFTRNAEIDKAALLDKFSDLDTIRNHIIWEYELKGSFNDFAIRSLSTEDNITTITADIGFNPQGFETSFPAEVLNFKYLSIKKATLRRESNGRAEVLGVAMAGRYTAKADLPVRETDNPVYDWALVRIATDGMPRDMGAWMEHLVSNKRMNAKKIEQRVNGLKAVLDAVADFPQRHDMVKEPYGASNEMEGDRIARLIVEAVAPEYISVGRWRPTNINFEEFGRKLANLHQALGILNADAIGKMPAVLKEPSQNVRSASVTRESLNDALQHFGPETPEGLAFREGLFLASKLALEVNQGLAGTASIKELHDDMSDYTGISGAKFGI